MSADLAYGTRARELAVGGRTVRVLEIADVDAALDRAAAGDVPAPYGVVLWASGVALAEAVAARDVARRRVVDVGAGVGAASLTAAHAGAEVIALDHDALALALVRRAADEAGVRVEARAFDLMDDAPLPDADLYLFADLLYEPELAVRTAERALEAHASGAEVLLADPDRTSRPAFLARLTEGGVRAAFVDVQVRVPGDAEDARVGVLTLAARAA